MFKRDVLYYENRIQLLSSKDAQANRALINTCMRKLRKLNMKGSDVNVEVETVDTAGKESENQEP